MLKSVLYDKNKIKLKKILIGQKIKKMEYLENIPIEDNSIKITFEDNSYFLIYAIMRIINKDKIILSSADYYFNNNFIEDYNVKTRKKNLIYTALKKVNKLLKKTSINDLEFNNYGDLVLYIGSDMHIEIFLDVSENEKDYYTYFGSNGMHFSLFKSDNQLLMIEDLK